MMAHGFKPVGWVAAVATAALGCYMLSLNVASERADLAKVERQIIATKQDIRSLQTELGTRGRMAQLEQWNSDVLALSAPASTQFVADEVTLARFDTHAPTLDDRAEVRMASADIMPSAPRAVEAPVVVASAPAPAAAMEQRQMVHRASMTIDPVKLPPSAPVALRIDANRPKPASISKRTDAERPAPPMSKRMESARSSFTPATNKGAEVSPVKTASTTSRLPDTIAAKSASTVSKRPDTIAAKFASAKRPVTAEIKLASAAMPDRVDTIRPKLAAVSSKRMDAGLAKVISAAARKEAGRSKQ